MEVLSRRHQSGFVNRSSFRKQVLQEFFGIDVYLWPVSWQMPPDNHVQVLHQIRVEASHQLDRQALLLLAYAKVKLHAQAGDVGGGFSAFSLSCPWPVPTRPGQREPCPTSILLGSLGQPV